jgi:hypothetical protein
VIFHRFHLLKPPTRHLERAGDGHVTEATMQTTSRILAAVTAAVLFSTVLGHAKRSELLRSKPAPASVADVAIPVRVEREALVIANATYPDADAPLARVSGNAQVFADALRARGYAVEFVANATRMDLAHAVDRLISRLQTGGHVALYIGGFGVQSRGRNYLIPVDAAIWRERDVRAQGTDVGRLLDVLKDHGAKVDLAYLDASARNPFERRFRAYSHGLAPIASGDTRVVSAAAPGRVLDDLDPPQKQLMAKLVGQLGAADDVRSDERQAID